jgi:hypothetical protein
MRSLSRREMFVALGATAVIASLPAGVALAAADRVAGLIALSRDRRGEAHIDRAALVRGDRVVGTLPISADEIVALRAALSTGDLSPLLHDGVRLGGQRYVLVGDDDDGTVVHAVRPGEFVTLRTRGDAMVVATSVDGMAPGRAIEAVYQYLRRSAV